jgi:subtilisin family serine protease
MFVSRPRLDSAVLVLVAALVAPAAFAQTPAEDPERVIVAFDALNETARGLVRQAGGRILLELPGVSALAARVPVQAQAGLARNPRVRLVEPDARRHLSAETIPWGIERLGAPLVWDANRDGAIDSGAPDGAGPLVCIIDSGLATSHPDLAGAAAGGYPADWSSDGCGHGTHVAGTIAGRVNGSGVSGVAPRASLYIVKVFGNDCAWVYASSLVDAAYRCRDAGAKIINMSLGGSTRSSTEERAFSTLYSTNGILSVAAAGNDGTAGLSYPASYASVISVAAVDSNNRRASFSQYNAQVELAAPGVGIYSSVPWSPFFESWNGTSMATPHVAGAAALALSARPSLPVADLRNLLRNTAVDVAAAGWDSGTGYGLVNVKAAVAALSPANLAPTVTITGPAGGMSVLRGDSVLFSGTATDPEQGDLSASLVWTSDKDGRIGAGSTFSTSTLSANTHVVTASVTDAAGATGRASITLTVTAPVSADTTAPVISGVSARSLNKKGGWEVAWLTNEASDTRVRFTCCGQQTNASLVTTHRMAFSGARGTTYEYFVRSADAAGNLSAEAGPFYFRVP